MEKILNQRLIFELPEETTIVEVIENILESNNIKEDDDEYFDKVIRDEETRNIIIRDAAITIFEKKISDKKVVDLLAAHLGISKETAEKIVVEIKEKLIPFAKMADFEKENLENVKANLGNHDEKPGLIGKEEFQKQLLEKLKVAQGAFVPEPPQNI